MNKVLCVAALVFAVLNHAHAQMLVNGKVMDAVTNQAIANATITDLNNQVSVLSDSTGNFILKNAAENDSILFSSVNHYSKIVTAKKSQLTIMLSPFFATLDEIVVSGSRGLQHRKEVPVAITVISPLTIHDTKATRLDMLINKVPGVFMVDLGNEQHEMAVRQPMGTRNLFLYLEDGVPIRTVGDFNHNALIEINQAAIERIEVVKGPASSLYGSEAVGGAINFITPSPSSFLSGKIQAEVAGRGYKRTDFSISNSYKKLGWYAGGYYANQNRNDDLHNDFRKLALTFKAAYSFNNKLKLSAVADIINYKTDQTGGLDSAHFYSKDYISFYRFTYRKVNALRIRTKLEKEWNENHKTSATFYYRHSSVGQNPFYYISDIPSNPLKANGQINEDAFKSYGAIVQQTDNFKSINAKLISGISADVSPAFYRAQYIDIDKNSDGIYYQYAVSDSLLTRYDVNLVNTAAYTQFEFNASARLKFVAAARYDRLDYKFDNKLLPGAYTGAPDAANHFDHFTPKAGITYNFKNAGGYLNYSVGFAPPDITDLYTGVKVPVLKAASYNNYEAGGWLSFLHGKASAELSVYKLKGKNEIVSIRLADGTYQNENAGETSHEGVELNVKYAPVKDINIRISGSYAKHTYTHYVEEGKNYSGNKMAQAPPLIYNSEIMYKPHYLKGFRISFEIQGMNKYFTDPENTATYNGFTVFNARAGYTVKAFEFWLNCLNITDKNYAVMVEKSAYGTSYRPGELRTINAGVAYNF